MVTGDVTDDAELISLGLEIDEGSTMPSNGVGISLSNSWREREDIGRRRGGGGGFWPNFFLLSLWSLAACFTAMFNNLECATDL